MVVHHLVDENRVGSVAQAVTHSSIGHVGIVRATFRQTSGTVWTFYLYTFTCASRPPGIILGSLTLSSLKCRELWKWTRSPFQPQAGRDEARRSADIFVTAVRHNRALF